MSDRLADYDERDLKIDQWQTQIELYKAQLRWEPCGDGRKEQCT
jgi:hypothetical protein